MPNGVGKTCGNEYFSVPGHTPVIFSEVGGRTLYRLLARDAGGETEGVLLNETVPAWVLDIVVEKKLPKFIKVKELALMMVDIMRGVAVSLAELHTSYASVSFSA